jgi:tetratricopeptide (TPR) repeat protein
MKKAFLITAVLLISLVNTGCHSRSNENCADLLKKYKKIASDPTIRSDTAFLLSYLDEMISKNSGCLDAYLTRGDLFLAKGNLQNAHLDYNSSITIDKANVYAYYKLGLLFQQEDLYDSSIYFLQKAIKVKTKDGWVVDMNHLNSDLDPFGEYDVASGLLYYTQGVSSYYKRDLRKAFSDFSYCIADRYRLGDCYLFLGAIYEESNKQDSACNDFRKAKLFGNQDADEYLVKYCH